MVPDRDGCCRNHSKLCFRNRILAGSGNNRLSRHDGFAYLAQPVVETVFSDSMPLAICAGRKTAGLLVQKHLLPVLDAVLRFDSLDLIQGNTSRRNQLLGFLCFLRTHYLTGEADIKYTGLFDAY